MLFQRSIIRRHRLAETTDRKTFETFGHVLPGLVITSRANLRYVRLMSDANPARAAEYPFSSRALRPAWASRRSRTFAGLAVVAALAAIAAQWPIRLVDIDSVTLRVILPATLAFVLAFAPRPASRVGRIARELTVLGLCAGMFAGDRLPLMLGCYPLLLMTAVVLGESRRATLLWGDR